MNEIIIRESKSKSIKLSFLGITMSMVSIFVLIVGFSEGNVLYIIIGIIGGLFLGICTLYAIKRTIKTLISRSGEPLLTINDEGIIDSSSMSSVGFITWEEIKSVRIVSISSQKFIGIEVNNLDELMNRMSFIKKSAIKMNIKMNFPPFNIRVNASEYKIDKVFKSITERLEVKNNI